MPDRFLRHLLIACGATFGAYVVFMVIAVSFAAIEVERSREARDRESAVVALETEYYAAITKLSKTDPAALGYVTPSRVEYVAADGAPSVSRADH